MIAVDTSIWVDHFRSRSDALTALLIGGHVLQHPFVTAELAMGSLRDWQDTVDDLNALPRLAVVGDEDFYGFIAQNRLAGSGVGFVDVHLMAAAQSAGARIWTRDARMASHAAALGMAFVP